MVAHEPLTGSIFPSCAYSPGRWKTIEGREPVRARLGLCFNARARLVVTLGGLAPAIELSQIKLNLSAQGVLVPDLLPLHTAFMLFVQLTGISCHHTTVEDTARLSTSPLCHETVVRCSTLH